MNKILSLAFILLALSVAQSKYIEKNFYKNPASVYSMNEGGLNRLNRDLKLQSIGSGELTISNSLYTDPQNIWYRKINPEDLSVISTSSLSHNSRKYGFIYGGYVIDFVVEPHQDGNFSTTVTQFNFEQNISLPNFTLCSGQPRTHIKGNDFIVLCAGWQTFTLVTFTPGEAQPKDIVVIPSLADYSELEMVKISSGKLLLTSSPSGRTKVTPMIQEILVDIEKSLYQVSQISVSDSRLLCTAYVTDKYYGSICRDEANQFYITRNSSGILETLFKGSPNSQLVAINSFGDYFVTIPSQIGNAEKMFYYELWDLETLSSVKGKVEFLTTDPDDMVSFYQSEVGDVYVMVVLRKFEPNMSSPTISEIKVGVLLSRDTTSEDDKLIQYFLA